MTALARRFVCPKCDWSYESPIPLRALAHKCPKVYKTVPLKKEKES